MEKMSLLCEATCDYLSVIIGKMSLADICQGESVSRDILNLKLTYNINIYKKSNFGEIEIPNKSFTIYGYFLADQFVYIKIFAA